MWHPPQPVAFNLIEAKRSRDRGARQRRAIMAKLRSRPEGYEPENSRAAVDCVRDLQTAVLYAFTAIESLANHVIDMLEDEGATLERKGKTVQPADMVWLSMDDKLKRVMPLKTECQSIAGDSAAWEGYKDLKYLRDELVHVKRRGYDSDPDSPTAYDRLMLGEGDACVESARAVVDGCWPGFLPDHVVAELNR